MSVSFIFLYQSHLPPAFFDEIMLCNIINLILFYVIRHVISFCFCYFNQEFELFSSKYKFKIIYLGFCRYFALPINQKCDRVADYILF